MLRAVYAGLFASLVLVVGVIHTVGPGRWALIASVLRSGDGPGATPAPSFAPTLPVVTSAACEFDGAREHELRIVVLERDGVRTVRPGEAGVRHASWIVESKRIEAGV